MNNPDGPQQWPAVLAQEYEALYGVAPGEPGGPTDSDERLRALHQVIHQRRPTALCLSGGGIRSATFGLGVLQALAQVGTLSRFDYLSTVSGGGYVGGWFTSWLQRDGRAAVMDGLNPTSPDPPDPLAPRTGGSAARHLPLPRSHRRHRVGRRLDVAGHDGTQPPPQLAGAASPHRRRAAGSAHLPRDRHHDRHGCRGRSRTVLSACHRRALLALPRVLDELRRRGRIRGHELRGTR